MSTQKRKPRSQKAKSQKKTRSIQAFHVSPPNATREETSSSVENQDLKFIPFFRSSNNVYINDIALRARRSPTHSAILKSKATFTCGKAFKYSSGALDANGNPVIVEPDEWVKGVNNKNQSLRTVFKLATRDYINFANLYVQLIVGKNFTSVFIIDSTKVRISSDRKTALISPFWRDIVNSDEKFNEELRAGRASVVDMWDGKKDTKQKNFIIHIKQDASEFDVYGLPEHSSAYQYADAEFKTIKHNLSKLDNGFMPSVMMTFTGTPPAGTTPDKFVKGVRDNFTGEGNNDKMFIQLVDDITQKPEVFEFSGNKEGEFKEMSELASTQIVRSHRWFPELAGFSVSGKLGGSQELRNQYDLAMNGVVIPDFQEPLIELFNMVLKMAGKNYEIDIVNASPVGNSDQVDINLVLTVDERREILGYEPSTEIEVEEKDKEDGVSED